jgi:hypothetical protein
MMSDDDLPTETPPPINTEALTQASTFAEIDAAMGVESGADAGEFHMRSATDSLRRGPRIPRAGKWR